LPIFIANATNFTTRDRGQLIHVLFQNSVKERLWQDR